MKPILRSVQVSKNNYLSTASRIRKRTLGSAKQEQLVKTIISNVQKRGDQAVLEYTRRFDRVRLREDRLRVSAVEIENALQRADDELVSALRLSKQRLQSAQKELLSRINFSIEMNGFRMRLAARPLSSVGCYIPGGKATYSSTVVMTAGLAKMAGVRRVVVCTPPDPRGYANDSILAAAKICDVDEVYRCGGAQAVSALAYGTRTIPRVDKIVGPGGVYVALAKKLVSKDVAIDFYAGPTEITILVDESTDTRFAAWDLIAQAEHSQYTLPCLVTTSEEIASKVRSEIIKILPRIERRKDVEASLAGGNCAICDSWDTACRLVNDMGPEHLELLTKDPYALADQIDSAGLILIGPDAPAAASDYCIGTDHVLPTSGFARMYAGLSVLDFIKPTWIVEGSPEGLKTILNPLKSMATAEGLPNHYLSVKSRFEK
jgi:histidinol dehydrogenase